MSMRVTQDAIEASIGIASNARTTLEAVEASLSIASNARTSAVVVEISIDASLVGLLTSGTEQPIVFITC